MLGNNYASAPSAHAHVCTPSLIVSYAKNIFTKFDTNTKKTMQFVEDCSDMGRAKEGQIILSKYFKQKTQKVLMVLKKTKETHYVFFLHIVDFAFLDRRRHHFYHQSLFISFSGVRKLHLPSKEKSLVFAHH